MALDSVSQAFSSLFLRHPFLGTSVALRILSQELPLRRLSYILSVCRPSRKNASRVLTIALTIACAFTFLAFLISLFILRRGSNGTSRLPSLITLGVGLTAAILTTIVFLIDVIFVAIVRKRVHDKTDGDLTLNWGNAVRLLVLFSLFN